MFGESTEGDVESINDGKGENTEEDDEEDGYGNDDEEGGYCNCDEYATCGGGHCCIGAGYALIVSCIRVMAS